MILWIHIAGGLIALVCGALAVSVRKGGRWHALAGTGFFAAMMVLGVTVAILEPYRNPPGSPVSGALVCYFILTSWVAARRRDGMTGWFEKLACAAALLTAGAMFWGAASGVAKTPVGPGPVYAMGGFCLLAGLLDLNAILRAPLSTKQRISRHLWRMCFAFFIATGSFFIGQQGVMPAVVRGSPVLFALGFAPLGLMVFWLARVRFSRTFALRSAGGRPYARPPVPG
ncbi:DUF2306 domain-containing protein [Sphingomonas sp. LB-2]|uniref:DUF2306 domain-containing protein n=1 Tax=Sphingomonas caeni TaxID=2984949 RepID=UPI0022321AF3|nr:DUF2306 domain-containing protein [Sphingomonas caeni]MCW3848725.1 DUF2306 domain-containing protein [Sphingomonas caeni]